MTMYGCVLCTYVGLELTQPRVPDYLVMIVLECIYQIRIICGRPFSVFIGYYSGFYGCIWLCIMYICMEQ